MRWAVLVVVLVGGCTSTKTIVCGEVTCPATAVCSPAGDACTTQQQIDDCADASVLECTAPEDRPGVCLAGYCQEVRCGDGRQDPSEACDDGNTDNDDGCNSDCTSTEQCGNSVIDPSEDCDDGNTATNDGCNAICRNESPIWRELVDTGFIGRLGHTMVYDPSRGVLVMFGGRVDSNQPLSNDTWEFDGDAWTLRTPATSPPAREYAAMAYHPARGVVLFGGRNATGDLTDTWEWNGTNWTQQTIIGSQPAARSGSAMAYYPGRTALVLYGGTSTTLGDLDDTWEYDDGGTWTPRSIGTVGDSAYHVMAFYPTRDRVIMYTPNGELFAYNGSWQTLTVTGARTRLSAMMAYDSERDRLYLIGGSGAGCGPNTNCGDAFILESTASVNEYQWAPAVAPFAPTQGAAAFLPEREQLVVMGGVMPGTMNAPESQTWVLDANNWNKLATPPPRLACQLAYLPSLGGTVLFGGIDALSNGAPLNDTWLFKQGRWSRLRPQTVPTAHGYGAMALDRMRGVLVLVDNVGGTWELDGTNWSAKTTATIPLARTRHKLAYDETRQRIVLHGGNTDHARKDVWLYDGVDWTELVTSDNQPVRGDFGFTYDVKRGALVAFGGLGGLVESSTHELVGSTWTEHTGTGPGPRMGHAMTYHRKRGSSVMFGGSPDGTNRVDDTWEYVDGAWRVASTGTSPVARWYGCSTYDESIDKVIVVGGARGVVGRSDAWAFGYE